MKQSVLLKTLSETVHFLAETQYSRKFVYVGELQYKFSLQLFKKFWTSALSIIEWSRTKKMWKYEVYNLVHVYSTFKLR